MPEVKVCSMPMCGLYLGIDAGNHNMGGKFDEFEQRWTVLIQLWLELTLTVNFLCWHSKQVMSC